MSRITKKQISINLGIITTPIALFGASCSTAPTSQAGKVQFSSTLNSEGREGSDKALTRAELEDAILRFGGHFSALTSNAFRPLSQSSSNELRRQAKRIKLNYSAYALDIALGPIPEQNLLDMIVFIELIRDVFRDYWLPEIFKDEGKPILVALEQASQDLQRMAITYLSPNQLAEIKALVDHWHQQNPDIVAVETVRLTDFSPKAGARAKQIESGISGLLAPVKGATAAADRALLLGERGLFYAQRAPFLMRMQSAAAVQDILEEVESTLSELPLSPSDLKEAQTLLAKSKELLSESQLTLRDLFPILVELRKLTELMGKHPGIIAGGENLVGNLLGVLKEFNQLSKSGALLNGGQIVGIADRIKTESRQFLILLFLVGALLILMTGIVYVLAKLTYERYSLKRMSEAKSPEKRKSA